MKLAVVGAGSTYTPELVAGLAGLEVGRLALHDIDPGRLEVVGGLAGRMLDRAGFKGELSVGGELDAAVDGADFVLVQIRVGGQAARLRDETAPLPCGCIGQETTGAGGFAKAMRTVPVVLEIADRVARARRAGCLDRRLHESGRDRHAVRCSTPATARSGSATSRSRLQRRFAALLGVEPARVVVDQVGLNHLTWVRGVLLDGEDVLGALLDEHGDAVADEVRLPRRLLDELGAVPSYYLRYFYEHDAVLAEQLDGVPRAATVAEIEAGLLELYRDPSLNEKPALLEQRGGAFYSEAAAGLVRSLAYDIGDVHEVDVRNEGLLAGLADDDVVEVPARIESGRIVPLEQAPLAPELLGLVQHVAAYERLTAEAAVTRDPVTAKKALLTHPLIAQYELSEDLLERLALEAVAV